MPTKRVSKSVKIDTPKRKGSNEPMEIQEEMERSFLEYSMSVIVARALPMYGTA